MSTVYRITQQAFDPTDDIQQITDIIDNDFPPPPTSPLTALANTAINTGAVNQFSLIPNPTPGWFYVGQVFTVTGTVSNDGTYTVTSIPVDAPTIVVVEVLETVVNEYVNTPVVFTDITGNTANVIDLTGSGKPKSLSVIDNDENPMTVIKAQQFIIEFNSDAGLNMNTFASGSDQRWSVHSYIGVDTQTIFKGFLVLDDMSEAFMPDPNIVVLTANDGLGLLKDIPLTDFDERTPTSYNRVIDYLAWCLYKTGLRLQINAAFNIKNSGFIDDISVPNVNDQHFFLLNYLDAKTFSGKNCYEVLQMILGNEARVYQDKGIWWIVRTDEVEQTRGLYVSTFDYRGTFIANLGEKIYEKEIFKYDPAIDPISIFFSKEQTRVIPTRPNKSVELDYLFENIEAPENKDFSEGDLIDGTNPLSKTYNLDSWNLFQGSVTTPATNDTAFVRRSFNANGYETERYGVIDIASSNVEYFLESSRIWVQAKDRFDFSVDVKYQGQIDSGAGFFRRFVASIRLYADDGTFYFLNGGTSADALPYWIASNSTFTTNSRGFVIEGDGNDDDTEYKTATFWDGATCPDIPKDGYLKIVLRHNHNVTSFEIDFANVKFDYIPFINGSYQKYTGQSQTVIQTGNYKAKVKDQVYMSDSPKRLFKGALHTILIYNAIITASAVFSHGTLGDSFVISGDVRYLFFNYQRILIQGTTSSDGFNVVKLVTYFPIGNYTAIDIYYPVQNETATPTISEAQFQLAGNYYNAAVFPSGPISPTYEHPYSEIQIFDLWNQFKTDKRIFQATCQGLELQAVDIDGFQDNAHLIHKWFFRDINENTNNREFLLLTFNQDFRIGEWTGLFREVFNTTYNKDYSNRTFKYLS